MATTVQGGCSMRVVAASCCTLEPLVAAHADEMFDLLADPAIYEFENEPPPSPEWLAARYARLESRQSADGSELWLNWVVRLPGGPLAGVVQATVLPTKLSYVAYELNSRHWRQGIGRSAVRAMAGELRDRYQVHTLVAVLKAANFRSAGLLRSLGFRLATADEAAAHGTEPDEIAMLGPSSLA
jgi:[ribosomal protein S5]-alanine N-acetyltransferase